jgi:hypothetical protein
MCSDTTRAITNTNLVIDARYCPALSSPSPCCRHAKTVLESFFVLCVYRPHDNGIGVASDKIRKSLLYTVSASSCYRKCSTLNDRSAVALVTGIVKMIHKMVSIEGYRTGFTASSVSQSEVGI